MIQWVLAQSGLDADYYHSKALRRRLAACLRSVRAITEEGALAVLQQNPSLLSVALSAVLIGVSDFFRDPQVFEDLQHRVLPQFLDRPEGLRVCSAGCSGGQELYSVAILLDELGLLGRSHLVGVDCRADAIEQARAGEFNPAELTGIGSLRRERFFRREGLRAVVTRWLRRRVEWRIADLLAGASEERWDVVLFRNVAIYLKPAHAALAWRSLERQLKPGGVLVSGKAEKPPPGSALRRESQCIYRKFDS